jgi:hypothetical protein
MAPVFLTADFATKVSTVQHDPSGLSAIRNCLMDWHVELFCFFAPVACDADDLPDHVRFLNRG